MSEPRARRAVAVDVATAGRPAESVAAAAVQFASEGGFVRLAVLHDEGCPCLDGAAMPDCTCEVVKLQGRRIA